MTNDHQFILKLLKDSSEEAKKAIQKALDAEDANNLRSVHGYSGRAFAYYLIAQKITSYLNQVEKDQDSFRQLWDEEVNKWEAKH